MPSNWFDKLPPLTPYKSKSGKDSGVKAYHIDENSIVVMFDRATYLYTYEKPGKAIVEKMKQLAIAGSGLSTFISREGLEYKYKVDKRARIASSIEK